MIVILLIAILSCSLGPSYAATSTNEYCTKEGQGTLGSRVSQADVVITGTVTRVETESRPTDDDGGQSGSPNPAEERAGRQTIAVVKLWRVVKGSLAQVSNYSSGPLDILSGDSENTLMHNPLVKLYGLWNDHFCGSFVKVGDTRIFFLRKFQDVRDIPTKMSSQPEEANNTVSAGGPTRSELPAPVDPIIPSDLREANMTSDTGDSATAPRVVEGAKKKERGKKKKKKGPKKNKKKERKRKKMRKNGKNSGERSRRKTERRKKRKTSESMYGTLQKIRSKRSSEIVSQVSRLTEYWVRVRRGGEPRSVLVLNSSPARINLANLNEVEELAKAAE